jgi:hypothetical protein
MKRFSICLLISCLSILAFDIIASFVSLIFQIEYTLFSLGSTIICIGIGFFGEKYGNLVLAVLSTTIAGIVDSTLGWYISWIIGPGRMEGELDLIIVFSTIVFVVFISSIFGLIGGLISYFINR